MIPASVFRYCVEDVAGGDRFRTIAQALVAAIANAIHALTGNPAQSLPIKFG